MTRNPSMDSAWFAVWLRLQSILQEHRLILQELRYAPHTDYQRRATEQLAERMRG